MFSQNELFSFLAQGESPFHAVQSAEQLLQAQGATYLPEQQEWSLLAGGLYYTKRNGSSIIAFRLPAQQKFASYRVTASHSDVPSWRLKTLTGGDEHYAKAAVEGYGGMIMSTWLDRPLSFAGRVMVKKAVDGQTQIETRLIAPHKAIFCIPNVAIHFNRTINSGYAFNPQVDLQPIFGAGKSDLTQFIREELSLGVGEEIVGHDLVLCPMQQPMAVGLGGEYFMSPRIDDLACAYLTLAGFLAADQVGEQSETTCRIWTMFDNEEVGSSSRQGAEGSFLPDVLARIEECCGLTVNEGNRARANGLLLSADNGHACHPNHPEYSAPEHKVQLGGGVVVKYNASQKYTTSAFTAAIFEEICASAGVSTQTFYNRADIAGGSTLGNLLAHQIAIPMLDIGLAQLAMHSAVETANLADTIQMQTAITAFYQARFTQVDDGLWQVK